MDNQQLRPLTDGIIRISRNAKLGDGCYWKHPECVNYKVIFNSINKQLLLHKKSLAPKIFKQEVKLIRKKGTKTNIATARNDMFGLASLVHPVFTEYKHKTINDVVSELDIIDLCYWFLDDGGVFKRNDGNSYRYFLCVGNTCETEEMQKTFEKKISSLFQTDAIGNIQINGVNGNNKNKVWHPPKLIGETILKTVLSVFPESDKIRKG